ncbi:MAG: hypothetical protein Q4G35_02385 [Propionibacteriaceae bacterium]|nr:hypothetical protein [Propionibacteriaceae bacterium]
MKRLTLLSVSTILAVLMSLSAPVMSASADSGGDAVWVQVTPAEARALLEGDDSVMDKYYASDESMVPLASRAGGGIEKNPDGCKLTVANMHWRKSTSNIGYKPTVKCTRKPIGVSLKNEVQKYMFAGWWKTEHTDNHSLTSKELTITTYRDGFTYKNVDKKCGNQRSTKWRGRTSSTIKATNGYTYYARQHSSEWRADCGT